MVGLSFNNSIFVRLKKFKSPGTTSPVLLNLQNRINVEMSIIELSISAGMVKVPQSTFGSVNDVANIQTVNSVKVKSAKIQSGKLSYQINSDVDLPLEILFELPSVSKGGIIFSEIINTQNGTVSGEIDPVSYTHLTLPTILLV